MYALLLLVLTVALGAAVRAERRRRICDGLLFGLLASAAVYAHVFAAFPVLVLTVFVVVRAGRRAACAALGAGAVAAAPAFLLVAAQAGHWLGWKATVAGADYWSSPMNLVAAAQAFFTAYALGSTPQHRFTRSAMRRKSVPSPGPTSRTAASGVNGSCATTRSSFRRLLVASRFAMRAGSLK